MKPLRPAGRAAPLRLMSRAALLLCFACGGRAGQLGDGGFDAGPCGAPTLGTNPDAGFNHLPIGTTIVYPTNPPAGGDHYPEWAVWGEHAGAVPAPYFVHNEEHGGIILLYNCPRGCPDLVNTLRTFMDNQPTDPLCAQAANGVNARFVLTPDPDLDVPVAAASWGFYYKQAESCVDVGALDDFIAAHYGQGRESSCAQGSFQ